MTKVPPAHALSSMLLPAGICTSHWCIFLDPVFRKIPGRHLLLEPLKVQLMCNVFVLSS